MAVDTNGATAATAGGGEGPLRLLPMQATEGTVNVRVCVCVLFWRGLCGCVGAQP